MSQRNGRKKKKNSNRNHSLRDANIGHFNHRAMTEQVKQSHRIKRKSKLGKAFGNLLSKMNKRGDVNGKK